MLSGCNNRADVLIDFIVHVAHQFFVGIDDGPHAHCAMRLQKEPAQTRA